MDSVRVRAPFVGGAFIVLGSAMMSDSVVWALAMVALGLWLTPRSLGWFLVVSVLGFYCAIKDEHLKAQLSSVRERVVLADGEWQVSGVLKVGAKMSLKGRARTGVLTCGGEEIRVVLPDDQWQAGDILQVSGNLFLPPRSRNPGVFDERDYWERRYLMAGLDLNDSEKIGEHKIGLIFRIAEFLRERVRGHLTRGVPPEAPSGKIILAMVMGESPGRFSEITQAFRLSGAMHVFAVSGLHVNLVAGLFFLVFLVTGLSRRVVVVGVLVAVIFYALVTGFRPPAVRAALMMSFLFGAFLFRRRASVFNALALSLIVVLLWMPIQVWDLGFQLSYGVLSAIALGAPLVYEKLRFLSQGDPFMPTDLYGKWERGVMYVCRYVSVNVATSTSAWLGSLPFMISQFGLVTPVAILMSVVLIPLAFAVLSFGMLACLVGEVRPDFSVPVNQLNRGFAWFSHQSALKGSALPGGHLKLPPRVPADLVIFDPADGGAASYFRHGGGVLIDTGSERVARRIIRPALARWRSPVETLVLTHADGRHVGGAATVLEEFQPQNAIVPGLSGRSLWYRDFLEQAPENGCLLKVPEELGVLNSWLEVLKLGEERDIPADDKGLIFKLNWDGWRVLFTGDAGFETEEALLGEDLSCDLIVMGRHGEHGYSGTAAFLEKTGARAIVISGGHYPSIEQVPVRWRNMVSKLGIELFWQKETGAVLVDFEEGEMKIRSYLKPSRTVTLD